MKQLCAVWCVACCLLVSAVRAEPPGTADPALRDYLSGNGLLNRGLYDLAAAEYRKFLDAHPTHDKAPVARYGLAVCLQRQARHQEAIDTLRPILDPVPPGFPFVPESFVLAGQSHLALGNDREAAMYFRRVLERHADAAVADAAAASLVEALYRDGQFKEAEQAARVMTTKWPDSPLRARATFIGALAAESRGDYATATRTLATFVRRQPKDPLATQAHLHLGRCYQQLARLDKARAAYQAVLERPREPAHADAQFGLAVIDAAEGRHDDARGRLEQLLKTSPPPPPTLVAAARLELGRVLLQQQRLDEAIDMLKALSRDGLESDDSAYLLGKCRMRQERWRDAVATLDRAIATWPDSHLLPEMHYDRAVALVRAGDNEATAALTGFGARYPDHALAADALEALANEAHRRGQYDDSIEHCKAFTTRYAGHARRGDMVFLLAENHYLAGRYAAAVESYRRVRGRQDSDVAALAEFRMGMALYRLGDHGKARPALERAAAAGDSQRYPAFIALGDMSFAARQYDEADTWLTRYLDHHGDGPAAADALIKRGLARQRLKRHDEALADYADLMRRFPKSAHRTQALFERGQVLLEQERATEAAAAFEQVLAEDRTGRFASHAQRHLATLAMQRGDYTAASERLAGLSEGEVDSTLVAGALLDRGQALSAAGDHAAAAAAFEAFLRDHAAHPRSAEVRARYAIALSRLERWDDALTAIEAAPLRGLDPRLAAAVRYEQAWCFRSLGRDDEAARGYRLLLKSEGQAELGPHATVELAELEFRAGRHARAARLIEQLDHSDQLTSAVSEQALYLWGVSLFETGRMSAAAEALERYLETHPQGSSVSSALFFAGEARFAQGEYDRAAKHLGRLVDTCPQDGHCAAGMLRLGESWAQLQQWNKSERVFTDYIERFGDNEHAFQARFGRGWARENLGRYPEAIAAYRQVIATHQGPTAARAQFQIGECLFAQRHHREAVSAFLKVEIHYAYPEWSAAALYEAGRCFEALTEPERATVHYAQLVEKHGQTRWASMASERLAELGER